MPNVAYKVVQGPDPLRISAHTTIGNNKEQELVPFMLEDAHGNRHAEWIKMNSIERESGSGETFNIRGYQPANKHQVKIFYTWSNKTGEGIGSGRLEFLM